MATQLTKNALEGLQSNIDNADERYVIQVLSIPPKANETIAKVVISDGFYKTKKSYFISEAAIRSNEVKELSILNVRKFINIENKSDSKDRIVIDKFEILYDNVTEIIGKPIDHKYQKNGAPNAEGSSVIPSKYITRNAAQAQVNNGIQKQPQNAQTYKSPAQSIPPPAPSNYFPPMNNNNNNGLNGNKSGGFAHNRVTQNPTKLANNPNQNQGLAQASIDDERDLESISEISPATQEIRFKARITNKGEKKNFKSQKGMDITLFSIDVIDSSYTEMTISFFGMEAANYFSYLLPDQIVIFKGGQLKANTNTLYNKGKFVMTVTRESNLVFANDDGSIPFFRMERKRIDEIPELSKDKIFDLIGFVKVDTEARQMTTKNQTQKTRRDIHIYDESRQEIEVTLWGDVANQKNAKAGDLIIIKDARINEYRDKKQVNATFGSQIFLNPELYKFPEASGLIQWRESINKEELLNELNTKYGTGENVYQNGGQIGQVNSLETSLFQIEEEFKVAIGNQTFNQDFKAWKEVRAIIHYVKDTPLYYDSCPQCKKKVKEDGDRVFCETCAQNFPEPESRYIISMVIGDSTGTARVSGFDEIGKQIFGYSANEFRKIRDNLNEKKMRLMAATNKEYRFLLLMKAERDTNTNSLREKIVLQQIKESNPLLECKRILNTIDKYLAQDLNE